MNQIGKNSKLTTLIEAVVILVVGILFCCSNAMGTEALSIIGGIVFITMGSFAILSGIVLERRIFGPSGIGGAFMLAFGIFFIVANVMGQYLFMFLPLLLIVLGAVILVDALLAILGKDNATSIVLELAIGVVALVLGICLWCIDDFRQAAGIVLGIVLIIYAIILVIEALSSKKLLGKK